MAPSIPRLFHWIWLGDEPLPEQHRRWIEGWLELHPGWKHVLWREENRPTFVNEAQFLAADSLWQKADVARYELVYRYGGIYLDTDIECLRSFEPLLDGVEAFAVEHRPQQRPATVQNFAIGATPGHPWLADTIARLPAAMDAGGGVLHETGPHFLTEVTRDRADVTVLSPSVFFHRPAWLQPDVPAGAFAVHHGRGRRNRRPSFAVQLDQLVRLDIEPVVPPGAAFVLVGKPHPLELSGGRTPLPFPERDGEWAGRPDADAIAAFARARAGGARFVVAPRWAAHWLETYPGFADYLRTRATVRVDNDRALIVELGDGS
jgi:hypothetical protein